MTPTVAKAVCKMIEAVWQACPDSAPQDYKDSLNHVEGLYEQLFGTRPPKP